MSLWPDGVKTSLVNQRGEIFRPRSLPKIPGLVSWEGPDANVALIHLELSPHSGAAGDGRDDS